jgi:pimeloyl-ACP methyl ester carboxylesterase
MRGLWLAVGTALGVVGVGLAIACGTEPEVVSPGRVVVRREVRIPVSRTIVLAGELAFPEEAAAQPGAATAAVVLISGSGPHDRDGARTELPGYLPFRDLANALLAAGFAVLRVDDRGTGASTGVFDGATTDDFAQDAAASVRWLRTDPAIAAPRIALVGHSEGALVALLVARRDRDIAALGLLGAASRPGREIARWQRAALVSGDQATWPSGDRDAVLARAERDADALAATDPWLHTWFALDPRAVARDVPQPVLLLHGETDRQVPVEQSDELAAVLHHAQVVRLPHTNHLLLDDFDGDPQGYVRLTARRIEGDRLRPLVMFLLRPPGAKRFPEGNETKKMR